MRHQGCFGGAATLAAVLSCLGTGCLGPTPAPTPTNDDDEAVSAVAAAPTEVRAEDETFGEGTLQRGAPRRGAPRLHSRRALYLSRALNVKGGSGYAEFTLCATGKSCANHLATTTFSAQFVQDGAGGDAGADAGAPACTTSASGACQVATCPYSGTSPMGVPAGTLTIGGGRIGKTRIPTNKFQDYVYSFLQVGSAFSPGDTLTLSGAGAKVPSFAAQSLVAPGAITLTAPLPGPRGHYTVTTTAPLALTWTGGTAGNTVFIEGVAYGATSETSFDCSWDATLGAGSVPKSMLAALAGQPGEISWGQQGAPVMFDAGKYAVYYLADVVGSAPAIFE